VVGRCEKLGCCCGRNGWAMFGLAQVANLAPLEGL